MPRDEERINFTISSELKSDLLAIIDSHRRNLSQELKLLIECYVAIHKNNGVINPDLTISTRDELSACEDKMRQIALDVYSERFDNRAVYSGTVHGLSVAEPDGKKFEKATLKQKSY